MDFEHLKSDNVSQLSNTHQHSSNSEINEELLSAFPAEKMLKFKNLNLNNIDYNNAQDVSRKLKETYLTKISKVSEKKSSLQSNINTLKDSTANTLREIQVNDISFNLIHDELDDVYNEIEECKNTLNLLRTEKSQLETLLSHKTEEYGSNFTNKRYQDTWSLKLSYLELLLGVTITNESGAMKVSFSKLGASNPYRSCSILLKLTDDKFIGLSCDPPIKNFNKLVSDLNNGLDFGSFLCIIRQSFKTML